MSNAWLRPLSRFHTDMKPRDFRPAHICIPLHQATTHIRRLNDVWLQIMFWGRHGIINGVYIPAVFSHTERLEHDDYASCNVVYQVQWSMCVQDGKYLSHRHINDLQQRRSVELFMCVRSLTRGKHLDLTTYEIQFEYAETQSEDEEYTMHFVVPELISSLSLKALLRNFGSQALHSLTQDCAGVATYTYSDRPLCTVCRGSCQASWTTVCDSSVREVLRLEWTKCAATVRRVLRNAARDIGQHAACNVCEFLVCKRVARDVARCAHAPFKFMYTPVLNAERVAPRVTWTSDVEHIARATEAVVVWRNATLVMHRHGVHVLQ